MKKCSGESGISLVETAVALAILGLTAVVFLGGLATISRVNFQTDQYGTAVSLAESQIESVKAASYVYGATQYPLAPVPAGKDYSGFSVIVIAQPLSLPDPGIQRITVGVSRSGKQVFSLESYKADR